MASAADPTISITVPVLFSRGRTLAPTDRTRSPILKRGLRDECENSCALMKTPTVLGESKIREYFYASEEILSYFRFSQHSRCFQDRKSTRLNSSHTVI